MPRSDDDSPRDRRRRDRYRSRDHSRSSSRDRDRRRRRDSRSRRRSISTDRKKSSYDRSPTSHRSKRRSTSRQRSSRVDHKKSRHRRHRSSSGSSASSRSTSYSSRSKSRKRSTSPDIVTAKKESSQVVPLPPQKQINLESAENEEKRQQMIEEIDDDSFVPKAFTSTKKVPDKVIIDLQKETISVPPAVKSEPALDLIIHPNFLTNDEDRMERWIRKLFIYRQKNSDQ